MFLKKKIFLKIIAIVLIMVVMVIHKYLFPKLNVGLFIRKMKTVKIKSKYHTI